MNTTSIGQRAETAVTKWLTARGYKVVARNYKTPRCEIDIVAQQEGTIYFVEVKYRRTARQGDGFDYITPAKLRSMEFAASIWVQQHRWPGAYELAAAAVTGPTCEHIELIAI